MNMRLLREHVGKYLSKMQQDKTKHEDDLAERGERKAYYQSWTEEKILSMVHDDMYAYMSKLWAMRIWGNKRWVVDKTIEDNGFEHLKKELALLVWGKDAIEQRWDSFRTQVKHIGPAMMSEILCYVHPRDCVLWNRRAYVGFRYLGVEDLPRYDYQLTGRKYVQLSDVGRQIAKEMQAQGATDLDLLTVDYFIWDELQVEDTLAQMHRREKRPTEEPPAVEELDTTQAQFVHNEIRDKLANIGQWLGFKSATEVKVAEGSVVDTVWEATIGNMGRVVYVFEVQTRGSIDSLIVNLLKSLNNPAVQGVVAVSDPTQLDKVKKHASTVKGLADKLKYWDYQEVIDIHDALQSVNEVIYRLGLVPESF